MQKAGSGSSGSSRREKTKELVAVEKDKKCWGCRIVDSGYRAPRVGGVCYFYRLLFLQKLARSPRPAIGPAPDFESTLSDYQCTTIALPFPRACQSRRVGRAHFDVRVRMWRWRRVPQTTDHIHCRRRVLLPCIEGAARSACACSVRIKGSNSIHFVGAEHCALDRAT